MRQGDPLSPFLFVLIMEAFSRMMNEVVARASIVGFEVRGRGGGGMFISHILFADDTLILCGTEVSHFPNLRCLLLCFEVVSGLKVNLSKTKVIPVGGVGNVQELAAILGCRVSSLPTAYLGLLLGVCFKSWHIWDGDIERAERRLTGWKRSYLSKGNRLTLIKSILSCLPPYFLTLFPIPLGVANKLERI